MLKSLLVACVVVCAVGGAAMADEAPVFDRRAYAEAKKAAETGKKWFIVKATASWCGPCKRMDKTTWRDEKVVKWVTDNAIAVSLDVDEHEDIAKELGIESMPTMVAFKEGKEFDRVVGYKDAGEFLGWLEGMAKGEKSIVAIERKAGGRTPPEGGKVDVHARMDLARKLASSGKKDEAADEYVWLWKHMLEHDRSFYGVRLSFMAGDMEELAARSAGAKKKFVAVRDETGKLMEGEKVDREAAVDWVTLNKIVDDQSATLGWYDKVKDQPRYQALIRRVERELVELFTEKQRWVDLGGMYSDPVGSLEQEHQFMASFPQHDAPEGMDDESKKELKEMPARMFREKVGPMYGGLLAAKRDKEAGTVAEKARSYDKSAAMSVELVKWALRVGAPRTEQVAWLEAEKESTAAQRELAELKAALAKK